MTSQPTSATFRFQPKVAEPAKHRSIIGAHLVRLQQTGSVSFIIALIRLWRNYSQVINSNVGDAGNPVAFVKSGHDLFLFAAYLNYFFQ